MGRRKVGNKKLIVRIDKRSVDGLKRIVDKSKGQWKTVSDLVRDIPTLLNPLKVLTFDFEPLMEGDEIFVKVYEILEDESRRVIYSKMPLGNFIDLYRRAEKFKVELEKMKSFTSKKRHFEHP